MEMKHKRPSHQDLKKKALENHEVRKEYERLKPFYEKLRLKIKKRIEEEEAGIQNSSN